MGFDELLKKYYQIKSAIKSLEIKLEELRELNAFPKTSESGGSRSTGVSRPAENFALKLVELQEKKTDLEESLMCMRNDLENYFKKIDDYNTRIVCEQRIFLNTSWKQIAGIIDKSYSWTAQLFNIGLKIIRNKD